jgi:cephalosporin hydroxylase
MNNMIKGYTEYKGYTAQQHDNFYPIIKKFINEVKPSRILEIGTAGGGFILSVRNILDELGLNNVLIKTYDIVDRPYYDTLRKYNIEINIENIFDHSYLKLIAAEKIVPFIQEEGVTIVFCDGGYKIGEFNTISPHIKKGDYILAHDYIDTWENYQTYFKGKIWDWCEIKESDIADTCNREKMYDFMKEDFNSIVWVCKIKK